MATSTPNYNLKKPSQSDFYNIDDHNANMDAIDTALKQTADAIEGIDLSSIPSAEKQAAWDKKETPEGAQAKADAAEKKAKDASLPLTGGQIAGALSILANAGLLNLIGSDHCYTGLYPKGLEAGRKAYYGFAGASSKDFTIYNEDNEGDVLIRAKGESISVSGLKQSVVNGKNEIAASINGKGGSATGSQTHTQLAAAIDRIPTGTVVEITLSGDTANTTGITATIPALGFTPSHIVIEGLIVSAVDNSSGQVTSSDLAITLSSKRNSQVKNGSDIRSIVVTLVGTTLKIATLSGTVRFSGKTCTAYIY